MDLPRSASGKSAYDVAHQAVMEASQTLVDSFYDQKEITYKGRGNVVTNLDYQAEEQVLDLLGREYPEFNILSEERGAIEGRTNYTWILDPLDGSRNYASGNPFFSVNIGLVHENEVVLGMTYDPVRKELFHALKGQGAFLNGSPIAVSRQASVQASVLGLDMGYSDERGKNALKLLVSLWPGMQTIRIMGSAALGLAYAACSRIDLYFHHTLYPWDLMSGILLVREAGGVITEGDGSPVSPWSKSVVASNSATHADFLRLTDGCDWRQTLTKPGSGSSGA